MKKSKKFTLKDVFEDKSWTILSVTSLNGRYKVEAKRPCVKNELNHFIGCGSVSYVESLSIDHRKVKVERLC